MRQLEWDQYEIALLIEACNIVNDGKQPKQSAVMMLSDELRARAIQRGESIDDVFRNKNGIALQMTKMNYLLSDGKIGLPGASKSYTEMVSLLRTDPVAFNRILAQARKEVHRKEDNSNNMASLKESFIIWLKSQTRLKSTPEYIVFVLNEGSEYALKHGLTKTSFWEISNPKDFDFICRKLLGTRLYRVMHRKSALLLDKVYVYYKEFLNQNIASTVNATATSMAVVSNLSETRTSSDSVTGNAFNDSMQEQKEAIDPIISFLQTEGLQYVDNRAKKGCLWVRGGKNLKSTLDKLQHYGVAFHFKPDGARATGSAPAWWMTGAGHLATIPSTKENGNLTFAEWLSSKEKMADATVRSYVSSIKSAEGFAIEKGIVGICLTGDYAVALDSIEKLLSNEMFVDYNRAQHNRFSAAFRKLRDYIASVQNQGTFASADKELENEKPELYHKLYSISKVYDDPQGIHIDRILSLLGNSAPKEEVYDFLDRVSWASKIMPEVYSFSRLNLPKSQNDTSEEIEPTDFDKNEYIGVLMRRFQNGMQFDSIDFDVFRDTYQDLYEKGIDFSDDELTVRLKYCGIIFEDRLFPAAGIIDNATKTKLFDYIDGQFAAGKKALYYKSIFADLADTFAYCFSLTDEKMLRTFIEYSAEQGKYYFSTDFMSVEKNVKIDTVQEIADYLLAAGKPLSFEEVYAGLSHISQDVIYREIQVNNCFLRNEKGHYFHVDIFEFSSTDADCIALLLNKEIEENGYAIWSRVFAEIQEQMPVFLENNLYLSSLGIRNALSRKMSDRFNFDSEVISTHDQCLSMADVFRLYGKHHAPFSDVDIYDFSKEVGTVIYFASLAEETVRVSRNLFIPKNDIHFDVQAIDAALETYLSSGYIFAKEVDSFLVFPNVGYEWNEFLLESYLQKYSRKFALINNGASLNNVAGAIVKKNGEYMDFVDICAHALAVSGVELKKEPALNYLAEVNLITRRSYRELETALTKARQIRNRKG